MLNSSKELKQFSTKENPIILLKLLTTVLITLIVFSNFNVQLVSASAGACEDAQATSITGSANSVSYTTPSGQVVLSVCIKSGSNMFTDSSSPNHSGQLGNGTYENGCYTVSGVGTSTVTVTSNSQSETCQEISHIDAYYGTLTPSPSITPSPTPNVIPTPSSSPTSSPAPTSTPTPSETPYPSPTPTSSPTSAPTSTPDPISTPTPTPSVTPQPTATPTATSAPTINATPTPTPSPTTTTSSSSNSSSSNSSADTSNASSTSTASSTDTAQPAVSQDVLGISTTRELPQTGTSNNWLGYFLGTIFPGITLVAKNLISKKSES